MFSSNEKASFGNKKDIFEVQKLHSEFKFFWTLGESHKQLGLKIWEMDDGRFYVTQSHHIHAPGQATPYLSSRGVCDSVDEALRTGIDNITAYGKSAIEDGHKFDDKWFIPNPNY